MATGKTFPHDPSHHINMSGTEQRNMLIAGKDVPPEFSRPEGIKVLRAYYETLE